MTQAAAPIPKDLADAFAEAVLAYANWHPKHEGRQIQIVGRGFFSIEEVGDAVSQFADQLPERVFCKLRSYMHDMPDGDLIAEIESRPTYSVGGTCLRRMIERRRARGY
jgi:hypothetical protein